MSRFVPLWDQNAEYSASVDRRLLAALWPEVGVSGGVVSAQGGGMIINVAALNAAIPAPNGTGTVLCVSDAVEQLLLDNAGGAGQHRYDTIVVEPHGADIGGPGEAAEWVVRALSSASGASPPPPAVPAGCAGLAQVYIAGNSETINPASITDIRQGRLAVPTFPTGMMLGSVTGPAAPQSGGPEFGIVVANFAAKAGHAYRATANILVAVNSGVGRCLSRLISTSGVCPFASTYLVAGLTPTPPGTGQAGTAVAWARAASAGNGQITLAISGDGTAVAGVQAHAGRLLIEEMGLWPAGATAPTTLDDDLFGLLADRPAQHPVV